MKKFIALFLSVMVLFSLAACGNGSASSDGFTQGSEWIEVQEIKYFINSGNDYGSTSYVSEAYTVKKAENHPVKIRFMSDGSLEIMTIETRYLGQANEEYTQIIRILPLSYKITYLPN